jgi:cytochrome P450
MVDYAQPYTLLVIADLLGVPEEDHPGLLGQRTDDRRMPGSAAEQHGDEHEAPSTSGHNTLDIFYDYFSAKIAERREKPLNDVLTGMAQALFPDGTMPEPIQVARIASNLFAAGQETTVRLIGTALRRIAEEPETQAELRANRELISRFVEETLRTEGPILGEYRVALKTTELGGVHIPAGTQIFLANGAANRDPRQFECPAEFRANRENVRRHVAFGHGIHTCPGAPLARSETRITIERLLDRTTDIRINEDAHGPVGARRYSYLPTHMFRGLTTLTLDFTVRD